jgi:catechol 2,3-dioxygenase-like lactoylglutathione lyase family enzyme
MKLTHVRLLVKDYPGCLAFYRDVIGLPGREAPAGMPYVEFDAEGTILAVASRSVMDQVLGRSSDSSAAAGAGRLALCLAVEDVDATFARIKAAGATVVAGPADRPQWHIRTAHFEDPEGNLVEINHRI